MSFVLVIVFARKFLLSGKIDLTKVPLGETLELYRKFSLILFLRTKTLSKGGSIAMTMVILLHSEREFWCTREPNRQAKSGAWP